MGDVGRAGAAFRRRQRQLRAFLRHEELSVKMALAKALHHSAQPPGPVVEEPREVEEQDTNDALRRQKAPSPGMHPGVLKEPEVQWFKGRSLFVSAGCPSLAVSSLAGHDGLDSTTLEFLLAQSLAPRAQELSNVESMVSTSAQFVPEESVEQRELSTSEVRWQWYRAHPSVAPDLSRFLPGVAGSASASVENLQSVSQLPGLPVVSLPVPEGKKPIASVSKSSQQIVDSPAPKVVKKKREVTHGVSSSSFSSHSAVPVPDPAPVPSSEPFMPMRFCSHLVRKGWCAYGDGCCFAHSFDELHPLAAQQEFDMADIVESWEVSD